MFYSADDAATSEVFSVFILDNEKYEQAYYQDVSLDNRSVLTFMRNALIFTDSRFNATWNDLGYNTEDIAYVNYPGDPSNVLRIVARVPVLDKDGFSMKTTTYAIVVLHHTVFINMSSWGDNGN